MAEDDLEALRAAALQSMLTKKSEPSSFQHELYHRNARRPILGQPIPSTVFSHHHFGHHVGQHMHGQPRNFFRGVQRFPHQDHQHFYANQTGHHLIQEHPQPQFPRHHLLNDPFPRQRPYLPLPPMYQTRPAFVQRFPRLQNRNRFPHKMPSSANDRSRPFQNQQTIQSDITHHHYNVESKAGPVVQKNEDHDGESSSQETRRLPGRFSRIDRSDSESEEDDRLDEYVDDDDDNKAESKDDQTTEVPEEQPDLESQDEGQDTKEEEDHSILDEILQTEYNDIDDEGDDLLGSGDEFDLYADKSPERSKLEKSPSPKRTPSPPKEVPDKVLVSSVVKRTVSLESKPETSNNSSAESRNVIIASTSPVSTVKRIRLKAPVDEDPAERRRRKFGATTLDNPVKTTRNTEEAKEGNSRKMRSFVVLRK